MHKNYRRKIKQNHPTNWWRDNCRCAKNFCLKQRTRARRHQNKLMLKRTLYDIESCEKIRKFEKPVDWYNID